MLVRLLLVLAGAEYTLVPLTMSAYYALAAVGLCVLLGHAGQVSLGQAAFFALGGYTSAVLTTCNLSAFQENPGIGFMARAGILVFREDLYGKGILHFNPWAALAAAVLLAVLAAVCMGIPALRLKGHYLAMATLGFCIIIHRIVLGTRLFGEADGISGVPAFALMPFLKISGAPAFRAQNYYFAWILLIAGTILLLNLMDSRAGRALRAIHDNETAAAALGVDTAKYKLRVFVISAVYAAAAGVFLTHYNGSIGPSEASAMKSIRYVAVVAAGGMTNLWGVLFFGFFLNFLSLRGVFGTLDDAVFGAVLVLIMLFAPEGVLKKRRIWRFSR
jgi:branched-chain amino acid transport system permease protein